MPLIILTLACLAVSLGLAWLLAYLGARGRILGPYNSGRWLPLQMREDLGRWKTLWLWSAAGVFLLAVAGLLLWDTLYPQDFERWIAHHLFFRRLFYAYPWLYHLHPLWASHLLVYSLLAICCLAGISVGVLLGSRAACRGFLLTRRFAKS